MANPVSPARVEGFQALMCGVSRATYWLFEFLQAA